MGEERDVPKWETVVQVAKRCGCGKETVRRACVEKRIVCTEPGEEFSERRVLGETTCDQIPLIAAACRGPRRSGRSERSGSVLEAVRLLDQLLADGPVSSAEVMDWARVHGISESTMHRARNASSVVIVRSGSTTAWTKTGKQEELTEAGGFSPVPIARSVKIDEQPREQGDGLGWLLSEVRRHGLIAQAAVCLANLLAERGRV